MEKETKDNNSYTAIIGKSKKALDDNYATMKKGLNSHNTIKKEAGDTTQRTDDTATGYSTNNVMYPRYNREALKKLYTLNEVHSACIDLKADCIAGKGYKFLADENNEKMKKVIEWAKRPNKLRFGYTLADLLVDLSKDIAMYDTVMTEITRDAFGTPMMYRANPAHMYMQPELDSNNNPIAGKVKAFWQVITGKKSLYLPYNGKESVTKGSHRVYEAHIQSPLSDYYGEPTYVIGLPYITENEAISRFNRAFIQNGAKLSYALIITGQKLTQAEEEKLDDNINELSGEGNQGKMFVGSFGGKDTKVDLVQLSQPFDATFLDQKRLNDESIMLAHRVSARLLGKSGSGNIGGSSEDYSATKKYLETVISMPKTMLENYINMFIEEEFGINPKIQLNTIDIMTEKDKAVSSGILFGMTDEFGNRAMDIESARKYNGLDESKLKTELLVNGENSNSTTISVGDSGKPTMPNGTIDENIDAPNNLSARDK
ncbi:MAG: phage portal protein [Clostridia bacterium]|nr:phage portal protein [Clostridia bacterium]